MVRSTAWTRWPSKTLLTVTCTCFGETCCLHHQSGKSAERGKVASNKTHKSWKWRQKVPPKSLCLSTKLHSITSRKSIPCCQNNCSQHSEAHCSVPAPNPRQQIMTANCGLAGCWLLALSVPAIIIVLWPACRQKRTNVPASWANEPAFWLAVGCGPRREEKLQTEWLA